MPWVYALLRGQKVLARTRADGSFDTLGGRVEIRYRATDARAYRASAANLSLVPGEAPLADDAVVPGQEAPAREEKEKKSASKSSRAAGPEPALSRDPNGWIAYTDGACSGNPGPAGSGLVVIRPGGKIDEGYEFLGTATNNVAELTGVLLALEVVPPSAPSLLVHTDSQYAIGVLTKGWKAKANQELIAKIRARLAERTNVRLSYVPGHAGVPMNERADELAREAIQTRRSKAIAIA
jgi:ribonuclease HI